MLAFAKILMNAKVTTTVTRMQHVLTQMVVILVPVIPATKAMELSVSRDFVLRTCA